MPNLREFHIANNILKIIGDVFFKNPELVSINMAGNPLYRLEVNTNEKIPVQNTLVILSYPTEHQMSLLPKETPFDCICRSDVWRMSPRLCVELSILRYQLSKKLEPAGSLPCQ